MSLDGNVVTGTIIGAESQPVSPGGPINNIGYFADVTAIVQAKGTGLRTFAIADGDTASDLFRPEGATSSSCTPIPPSRRSTVSSRSTVWTLPSRRIRRLALLE